MHESHLTKKYLISVAPLTRITLTRDQSFFYMHGQDLPCGTLVEIPVGRRVIEGIVTRSVPDFPRESTYVIKPIRRVIALAFLTQQQLSCAQFISTHYFCPLGIVLPHFIPDRVQKRGVTATPRRRLQHITQNAAHTKIINTILTQRVHTQTFLLHILTSADKYGILLTLIQQIITQRSSKKQVLLLLPELLQVPFLEQFFTQFFPQKDIAIIHGKLGKGAYYDLWQKIKNGTIRIVIGTRSAVFLPFYDLGMIIVDDVHDMSHKQWEHYPLFDARIVAQHVAQTYACPLVLTSATPRVADYMCATTSPRQTYLTLPHKRATPIEIIDMKIERWEKNRSPLSRMAISRIRHALKMHKQILIFVNRHGESAFTVCTQCRTVMKCPTCQRALAVSHNTFYTCPHCSYRIKSKKCLRCHAPLEHVGIGTTRIAKDLQKIFPAARCAVVDSTTMKKPQAHLMLFRDFRDHKIDIIIGTQMITKGWHTDTIGLSIIIDMDNLLSLPAYDVNEKAFAFVVQMASRVRTGTLLVQTFQPEDPVLQKAKKYDFTSFYEEESALRKILSYPPYTLLIKMTYQDTDEKQVKEKTTQAHAALKEIARTHKALIISDPHAPLVPKVRTKYRKQIIIKCTDCSIPPDLHTYLISRDIKWSIDIDPVQLI